MTAPIIHLVFKTHLDIGFTDHAARVRRQYHEQFIPQAIATGEHFHREAPETPAFIWTTGAWLIFDHLETQPLEKVKRLEAAIERGLVTWHALPFTTHTELMTPALFRAGLSYAEILDRRFGRKTTAAKMTDVPGHTIGMVPLLAEAGVRFLHLGVNTASPVPDVPPIFRWRAGDGSEVVVMYQGSYGATDFPAGPDVGLSFAHTNDNIGPQSVPQTVETLRHLRHENPGAVIRASTLDAFGEIMWARRAELPVVEKEIGDSWIHGTASDPSKLARYRALARLYDRFEAEPTAERRAFGRGLTMIAEHTWGVDIKSYLRDETAWDRADFDAMRAADYRFAFTEQSWAEQRGYLEAALGHLVPADRAAADAALAETEPAPEPASVAAGTRLSDGGWTAELDGETGDIAALVAPDGRRIEGVDGCLFGYRHESYDAAELQKHLDAYLQHRIEWAILDHDKPGLASARTARTARFAGHLSGIAQDRTALAELPDEARQLLGGPRRHALRLTALGPDRVEIALVLYDKPANRMPEAGFLLVTPRDGHDWSFEKLGRTGGAGDVVARGGGQLQAVQSIACAVGDMRLAIEPLDSMHVAPADIAFMPFHPAPPSFAAGVAINLYNNKWGTNFPMWWEGSIMSRLIISLA
ncbi:DUF5054 domain-containing protein [Kaistia geumhonensis]|uniref:DUF5054 domain-containing protein n=1 Tax=Kaistia geumhonensis TaxID=410839 RepID=A0ABU0M9X6_9HYPH|nr:DUF5054 domain-containing protein [Kaistia geumhonensis]MCX5480522.1 DUF5054 domain-containing protein [Kaistia geumhonensis]MDQ0517776.1 hypothetical protein [Kaistia geumhonensis]